MEVDNVQARRNTTLKRAIETVTKATELDVEGLYEEAVAHYDSALTDFDWVISLEKSQVVRDCVLSKMDAYAYRSDSLKKFLQRSRSPSSDGGGSVGVTDGDATETSASSDSGVETVDDLGTAAHNLSADSATDESGYATIYEPRQHQQQSRQQFLDACAEQVEQLLQIINDEHEPEQIRERARERCEQILDFAVAYRRDFCPSPSTTATAVAAADVDEPPPPPLVARTVSVASSMAPTDPLLTRQLVHAEVLLSADDEAQAAGPEDKAGKQVQPAGGEDHQAGRQDYQAGRQDHREQDEDDEDACPDLPDDGDKEFSPLTFSMDSLRFADADSPSPSSRRSDSPDYATVRRATPSPRKQLSQASLNKIETECEPLLLASGPGCALLPASDQRSPDRWWRRRRADSRPEPMEGRLTQPSMFWVVLGSICG